MPHARARQPVRICMVSQVHLVEGVEHGDKLLHKHLELRRSLPELRDAQLPAARAQIDGALHLTP